MPQEFHILRCYSCGTFQVHIVKKSNKWDCKMCGEKQSVKKVYGKGTGKECRLHVQMLNEKRVLDESIEQSENEDNIYEDQNQQAVANFNIDSERLPRTSKWGEYLVEETTPVDDVCEQDDGKFTFERPKKRKSFQRNVSTNEKRVKKCNSSKILDNDTEKFQEDSNESTKIHSNSLAKKKINPLIEETDSTCQNINSKWNTFVSRDDIDINCTSSSSNIKTNYIDVPKLTKPKKSKWDNFITETECENEISSQEINIFNASTDCENLDDILDIQI